VPACTGPNSLVICASYSGNTEETLSCFEKALEHKGRIVVLTTGGMLAKLADEHGIPRIAPQEGIQPRAALASLAVAPLIVLERLGLLPDLASALSETEAVLATQSKLLGRDTPVAENPAKDLARRMNGMLPLIWGQDGVLAAAAVRWRCQLNENAKVPAFSSVLPELDHNELVGYDPGIPSLEQVVLVVLRKSMEHPRVTKRIEITLESVRPRVGMVTEVWATGESRLAQLMSASLIGDFTSIYLSYLRGVDPTPVPVIEDLKLRLG
jgi:glucose/mannose-6-phosphate isomerase